MLLYSSHGIVMHGLGVKSVHKASKLKQGKAIAQTVGSPPDGLIAQVRLLPFVFIHWCTPSSAAFIKNPQQVGEGVRLFGPVSKRA